MMDGRQKEKEPQGLLVFLTRKKAEDYARSILQNNGGGELITQSPHGHIRSKDTINSRDPNPPKDREH